MTRSTSQTVWREAFDIGRTLIIGLLIAVVVRSFIFHPFTIPSSSMSPGLLTGDYIIVSKYAYGWSAASLPVGRPEGTGRLMGSSPERGDVVVFRLPRDRSQVWIKRVIGLPGDTVETINGQLYVNQQAVPVTDLGLTTDKDDPRRQVRAYSEDLGLGTSHIIYDGGSGLPGDNTGPIHVPAGHYLMMGDNRDNSIDGRWPASIGVGLLPASHILGRADLVLMSWKPDAGLFKPWTWPNIRGDRWFKPID